MRYGLAQIAHNSPVRPLPAVLYYSPEQADGEAHLVTNRADIYSLGATFYEMLCGKPPFADYANSAQLKRLILATPPRSLQMEDPSIPDALDHICARALRKRQDERYRHAGELAAATLREVGGTTRVGVAFLEETFGSQARRPELRHFEQAVRGVLKSLLPAWWEWLSIHRYVPKAGWTPPQKKLMSRSAYALARLRGSGVSPESSTSLADGQPLRDGFQDRASNPYGKVSQSHMQPKSIVSVPSRVERLNSVAIVPDSSRTFRTPRLNR